MKWQFKNLVKAVGLAAFSLLMIGQANAQCETWEAFPEGAKIARQKHVIYRDKFKLQKYEEAYPLWEELFKYVKVPAPAKSTHFLDGATMSFHFAGKETDQAKKNEWIEKAINLYDQNAACNGETALDRAYQAYYMYANQYDVTKTLKVYEKVLELGNEKEPVPSMIFTPMAYLAVYCYQQKVQGIDADYMRNLYLRLEKIAKEQIEKGNDAENYKKGWGEVDKYYSPIKDGIFGCDYYITKVWRPLYNEHKEVEDSVRKIRDAMSLKSCNEEDFYKVVQLQYEKLVNDRVIKTAEAVLASDTSTAWMKILTCRQMGQATNDESWKEKEKEYYKDLVENDNEWCANTIRADIAYRYADQLYRAGSFGSARSYCRLASKIRPDWGQPYLLVGIMYASSGPRCSAKGTGWDAQICVWPAIDEWVKAKSVDPSVTAKANEYIAKYSAFMPSKTDIFKRQLQEGASITVPCWIQQTTTIRGK